MFCGNVVGVEEKRRAFLGEDTFDDVRLGLWEVMENGCRIVKVLEIMKEIGRRKEMKELEEQKGSRQRVNGPP